MGAAKLVLVEDNPGDVALVQIAMTECCDTCECEVFADGHSAIAYLRGREFPEGALVVLDLNLPMASGFDVLEALPARSSRPMVDAVVLTSSSRASDRERALAMGASRFFSKPSSAEEVHALGKELCDALRALPQG